MPGFLTDRVNNSVLDCFFGGVAITPPSTLYVGLSLTKAYKGGYVSEPLGEGYERVAVRNDLASFFRAASGMKSNASPITFPAPSASWGVIRSVFVADESRGGRVLAMADLPAPRTIEAGDRAASIVVNALFLSHS